MLDLDFTMLKDNSPLLLTNNNTGMYVILKMSSLQINYMQ